MTARWPFEPLEPRAYQVLYVDPPWYFRARSPKGESRSAKRHYGVLDQRGLIDLPVGMLAAEDCALFLWVVQPMLPHALDLIKAWGFEFKTVAYVWIKIKGKQDRLFYAGGDVKAGLGYHTRAGSEQCWLAARGKSYKRLSKREAQVLFSPLREHSRKPDEVAASIERLTGDVPRAELFARTTRPGWASWGLEKEKFQ